MTKKEKLQNTLSEKGIEYPEDATIPQLEALLAEVDESTEEVEGDVAEEGDDTDTEEASDSDEDDDVAEEGAEPEEVTVDEVEPEEPKGENPDEDADVNEPRDHFYIVVSEKGDTAYVVNRVGQRVSPLIPVEEARESANRSNSMLGIKGVQI